MNITIKMLTPDLIEDYFDFLCAQRRVTQQAGGNPVWKGKSQATSSDPVRTAETLNVKRGK